MTKVNLWGTIAIMNISQIAKKADTSIALVSYLVNNKRKTTNIPLAIAVAQFTGKRPVEYLSDKIKTLALKIYPHLNRKVKP